MEKYKRKDNENETKQKKEEKRHTNIILEIKGLYAGQFLQASGYAVSIITVCRESTLRYFFNFLEVDILKQLQYVIEF